MLLRPWPKQNSLTEEVCTKCNEKLGSVVRSLPVAELREKLEECPQKILE